MKVTKDLIERTCNLGFNNYLINSKKIKINGIETDIDNANCQELIISLIIKYDFEDLVYELGKFKRSTVNLIVDCKVFIIDELMNKQSLFLKSDTIEGTIELNSENITFIPQKVMMSTK